MQLNCFKPMPGKKYTLFSAAQSGSIAAHAGAAASFSRAILNKYTSPEDYGMPPASFVHPAFDGQGQEEDALALSVKILLTLNHFQNISISSAYEKRYYNLLCRQCIQILSSLENSQWAAGAGSRERVSEPDRQKRVTEPDSREELDVLHSSKESAGLENQRRLKGPKNQQYQRTAIKKELEKYLQEIRREVEGTGTAGNTEISMEGVQTSAENIKASVEIFLSSAEEFQSSAEDTEKIVEERRLERQQRLEQILAGMENHIKKQTLAQNPSFFSWKSEQAKQFFWRVQRAPKMEQRLLLAASNTKTIVGLMNKLKMVGQHQWAAYAAALQERVKGIIEDNTFLLSVSRESGHFGTENLSKTAETKKDTDTKSAADKERAAAEAKFLSSEKTWFAHLRHWLLNDYQEADTQEKLLAQKEELIFRMHEEWTEIERFCRRIWENDENAGKRKQEEYQQSRNILTNSKVLSAYGLSVLDETLPVRESDNFEKYILPEFILIRTAFAEYIRQMEAGKWKAKINVLQSALKDEGAVFSLESLQRLFFAGKTDEENIAGKADEENIAGNVDEENVSGKGNGERVTGKVDEESAAGKVNEEKASRKVNEENDHGSLVQEKLARLRQKLQENAENEKEKIQSLKSEEIREWYQTAMEAVSYLGETEWSDLKAELSFSLNESSLPVPVFQWLLEGKADAKEEKRNFITALSRQMTEEIEFVRQMTEERMKVIHQMTENQSKIFRHMTQNRNEIVYQTAENSGEMVHQIAGNLGETVRQIAENQREMIHRVEENQTEMIRQMTENQMETIRQVEGNQREELRRVERNQREEIHRVEERQSDMIYRMGEVQTGDALQTTANKIVDEPGNIYRVKDETEFSRQKKEDKIEIENVQLMPEEIYHQSLTYLRQHVTESDKEIKREEKERGGTDRTQTINPGTGNVQFAKQETGGSQGAKQKIGSSQNINSDISELKTKSQYSNILQANRHELYEASGQNTVKETNVIQEKSIREESIQRAEVWEKFTPEAVISREEIGEKIIQETAVQEDLIQGENAQNFVYLRRWLMEKNQENHTQNREFHAKNQEIHVDQAEEIEVQKEDFLALLEREIHDNSQVWEKIKKNPQKLDEISLFPLELMHKFEAWERVRKLFENSEILSGYIRPGSSTAFSQVSLNFQTPQDFQAAPNFQTPQDFQAASNFQTSQDFQAAPNFQTPLDFQASLNLKSSYALLPASFVYFIRQMHTGEWKEWKQGVQAILEKKEPFVETIRNIFSLTDPGRWYQNVMEAISYLDEGEWKALKQEFSEEEPFLQAVPLLLRHSEKKADMGEEKRRLIHVLVRQMNEEKEVMERLRQHNVQDFTLLRERKNIDERLYGIRENLLEMLRTYENQTKEEAHKIFFSLDGSRPGTEVFPSLRWLKRENSYDAEYSGIKMQEAALALVEEIRDNRIRILSPTAEERNQEEKIQEKRIQEKRNALHHPEIMQDGSSLSYHSASMVVAEHAGGRTSQQEGLLRQKPPVELSADIVQQVREETDIQFKTREQRTAESGQENIRAEMEKALKKLEQQQIDLEEKLSGSQEKISKSVMKKLQSQLRIDRMRHGM